MPPEALAAKIPTGKETKRLLDNGFAAWGDLYSSRQLEVLAAGLKAVALLQCAPEIKDRLAFSLLGAAEMPAFLSRWDRFNLKPFEGMANHRYTQTTFAVESNLLSPVGRGTIPRRLEAAAQALQWFIDSRQRPPKVATTVPGRRGRKKTDWDVLVTTGSSVKQALQTGSVNVVVTDPPYFDDVQYGELARLFHAWLKVYDPSVVVDESAEAVPNSTRGTSTADYEATIAACLAESRRTLKANGRLILTFHNKKVVAWRALAGAIATAGLKVTALAAVLAENQGDHCKRSVNAMLHDLVIECAPANTPRLPALSLEFIPKSAAEKNLAAMGLALADCVAARNSAHLGAGYRAHLERLGVRKRLID
jgi:putative DNA methylase